MTEDSNDNIAVSIIVPIYNVASYLRQCLDSIVNQTLSNFEVICINDGSTDNSLEIINEYASKDERFNVISQKNQGQGIARNNALRIAKGKYILFVDPDDWIELETLETLYNFAEDKSANIVRFDYKNYDEYTKNTQLCSFSRIIKKLYNYNLFNNDSYNWRMFKKGCLFNLGLAVWSYLYNRKFIIDNNITFAPSRRGEDHLFSVGSMLSADKIYYLEKSLYTYRTRPGSAVNSVGEDSFAVFDNIKRMKELLISNSLYQELEDEFLSYSKNFIRCHYNQTPENMLNQYESMCKAFFKTDKEFNKWLKKTKTNKNFIENIFSLKNKKIQGIKHKEVTILGLTFYIKPKQGKAGA